MVVLSLNQGRGTLCKALEDMTLQEPQGQGGQEAGVYFELQACWELSEDRPVSHPQAHQPTLGTVLSAQEPSQS